MGDINDTLPVFEGIYLALDATESYTLTFSGTLPVNDVTMSIPQTAFNVLVGNATNANASLNAIDAQFGDNNTSFRCWNTRTLQFDQYISGLSTNDLSATLQPNTTCEFAPSGVTELTMVLNDGLPKGHTIDIPCRRGRHHCVVWQPMPPDSKTKVLWHSVNRHYNPIL